MKCNQAAGGLGCCPFYGDGSVVVDSLFYVHVHVLPIGCGGFCVCLCFVVHYIVSFLV